METSNKKIKMYVFLLVGVVSFMSAFAMGAKKEKIRVFDFKYEKYEFLKGDVVLELPGKSNRNQYVAMYYKVLVDKYIDLTSGHFEISVVDIDKYMGPKKEELKNKLEIRITRRTDKRRTDVDLFSVNRMAFWHTERPIVVTVGTLARADTFSTEAERDERIKKDDEIFEHIVESFRYRKEDGTYAKPEIIRQPEEVKEIEHTGVEYHGNK